MELGNVKKELSDPKFKTTSSIKKLKKILLESSKEAVSFINEEGGADSPKIMQAQEILEKIKSIRSQEEALK